MPNAKFLIEIDNEADAAYVRISKARVAQTREVADGILIDLDANDGFIALKSRA